jgi:tight adherence protein B
MGVIDVRRRVGAFSGLLALLLFAVPSASAATPATTPAGQISDVQSQPGQLKFVFSADDLAPGDTLDPKSVVVSAGDTSLPATAVQTDAGNHAVPLTPRAVVLVLDVSGSMAGSGITAARAAALTYAKGLPADVKVGLLTFSDTPHTLLAPTTDRGALTAALGKVQAGGNTALYDGIIAAVAATASLPKDSTRRLLILSDGADTSSRRSQSDATKALATRGVAADVVAFRLPGDQAVLDKIATASHGRVLPAASAGDLANAFSVAAQAFQQQLLITVEVPAFLAGQAAHLTASVNAGSQSVSATTAITLPAASDVVGSGNQNRAVGAPTASVSQTGLWVVLAVAFIAILIVALMVVWIPATSGIRSEKQSRLAEVSRYRLLGTVGRVEAAPVAAPTESNLTTRALSLVDKAVRSRGKRQGIVDELDRAGIRMRPEEWAVLQVCAIVVLAAILTVLSGSPIGLLAGGVLAWLAFRMFIKIKISRRAAAFADQLPDMLQLVSGSLRSGFSLNQAVSAVVREGTEPMASEISRTLTETRLGSELEDALDRLADRMQSPDLHWVVMAVRISREVGGNLAEVLLNTVATMRERAQIRGQIRVLSAEGRISARILIALPFVLGGYFLLFNPNYMHPLFTTAIGLVLLVSGAVLLVIGSFWITRLVKIEV